MWGENASNCSLSPDCSQSPIFPWHSRDRARPTVNGRHLDFKCTESIKSRWPPLTVRRARSRRSHGKIGDCEQSSPPKAIPPGHFNYGTCWKGTQRALYSHWTFPCENEFYLHENEKPLSYWWFSHLDSLWNRGLRHLNNNLRRLDIQWEIQYKGVVGRAP